MGRGGLRHPGPARSDRSWTIGGSGWTEAAHAARDPLAPRERRCLARPAIDGIWASNRLTIPARRWTRTSHAFGRRSVPTGSSVVAAGMRFGSRRVSSTSSASKRWQPRAGSPKRSRPGAGRRLAISSMTVRPARGRATRGTENRRSRRPDRVSARGRGRRRARVGAGAARSRAPAPRTLTGSADAGSLPRPPSVGGARGLSAGPAHALGGARPRAGASASGARAPDPGPTIPR